MWSLYFVGETDWKVLAINVEDPLAQHLSGDTFISFIGLLFDIDV